MHALLRENAAVPFVPPPRTATWLHQGARTGFEVVHFTPADGGHHIVGCTTAEEDGQAWAVWYEIEVSSRWETQRARISHRTATGARDVLLEKGNDGRWLVDGVPSPALDACCDVDLESSAMTNAIPVHRLDLAVGEQSAAPAVYVRAVDLSIERLEQCYERLPDEDEKQVYDYLSPAFDFAARLVFDPSGLAVTYPGIAVRHG
jgi:hypothetical protein